MAGLPVYGVAMCTLDGIRNVLQKVLGNTQQQHHRPANKVSTTKSGISRSCLVVAAQAVCPAAVSALKTMQL
jgi:adenylylsulfate kinase-like enzyme